MMSAMFQQALFDMSQMNPQELAQLAAMVQSEDAGGGAATIKSTDWPALIDDKDSRVMLPSGKLVLGNNCLISSLWNQRFYYGRNQQLPKLRVVCGSLGLGLGKDPFFEFGNPEWTTLEQFRSDRPSPAFDAHIWLVDDLTGAIYDSALAQWWQVCDFRKKKLGIARPSSQQRAVEIDGQTPQQLAQTGLVYVEAPNSSQLVQSLLKLYSESVGVELLERLGLADALNQIVVSK